MVRRGLLRDVTVAGKSTAFFRWRVDWAARFAADDRLGDFWTLFSGIAQTEEMAPGRVWRMRAGFLLISLPGHWLDESAGGQRRRIGEGLATRNASAGYDCGAAGFTPDVRAPLGRTRLHRPLF